MEEYNNELVSQNLKAMRARSGLTQKEVAEKIGVSVKTFRTYEKDPGKMAASYFWKLADLYGCLPRIFFMDEQSPIWGN